MFSRTLEKVCSHPCLIVASASPDLATLSYLEYTDRLNAEVLSSVLGPGHFWAFQHRDQKHAKLIWHQAFQITRMGRGHRRRPNHKVSLAAGMVDQSEHLTVQLVLCTGHHNHTRPPFDHFCLAREWSDVHFLCLPSLICEHSLTPDRLSRSFWMHPSIHPPGPPVFSEPFQ